MKMKMETLRSLRLIAKPSDHFASFDVKDGFYSLAIAPQNKEAFTLNLDGKLLQFYALPMGWSLGPFVFQKLTEVFADHLNDPESSISSIVGQHDLGPKALKRGVAADAGSLELDFYLASTTSHCSRCPTTRL
jgi:hypothetical protein